MCGLTGNSSLAGRIDILVALNSGAGRGLVDNCNDTCMAFSSLESPSAPKDRTTIPLFYTLYMYFHLLSIMFAENLLSVPTHAKQNAGTLSLSDCAIYTKAYFAYLAVKNAS